jgi:hypothetical protein
MNFTVPYFEYGAFHLFKILLIHVCILLSGKTLRWSWARGLEWWMNVRLPLTYIHWRKASLCFSNHKMPVLSIFTCRIVPCCFFRSPSSVVFLSGPSSADQLFLLSFPTFNGYFELTTAARNLNVIGLFRRCTCNNGPRPRPSSLTYYRNQPSVNHIPSIRTRTYTTAHTLCGYMQNNNKLWWGH